MNFSLVGFPSHYLVFHTETSTLWLVPLQAHQMSHGSRATKHLHTLQPHLNCCQDKCMHMGLVLYWINTEDQEPHLMPITDSVDFTFSASFTFLDCSFPITEMLTVTWRFLHLPFLYYFVHIFPLSFISFSFQTLYIANNDLKLLTSSLLLLQCWHSRYWSPWPMQCWDLNRMPYTN